MPDLPVPLPIEAQAIPIHFLASVRFDPPEYGEHALEIQLIRPNGEAKIIGNAIRSAAQKKFPEVRIPSGIDFRGAFGLIPRAVGTHYIALLLDGEEVARAPVTLIQRDAPKGVPEQPR